MSRKPTKKTRSSQKSSPKKSQKEKKDSKPLKDQLKNLVSSKRPIWAYAVAFALLMLIFNLIMLTDFFQNNIFEPLLKFNAWAGSLLLNIMGQGTTAGGDTIYSKEFSMSIRRGCDALEPTALFISALLIFPVGWRKKLPGILVGGAFLLVMNFVRIVSLFFFGVYWEEAFDIMHSQVWQVIFILLALISLGVWIQWATRKKPETPVSDDPA